MVLPREVGFAFFPNKLNCHNLTNITNIKTLQENRKDPIPLLVNVYGGPGSQLVREPGSQLVNNSDTITVFGHLVEKHGIALAAIDPVGTGFQGAEKMFRFS